MVMDRLAIDSNAFIAYRAGDTGVRTLIEQAKLLCMPMTVMGELLYGALNSLHREENVQAVKEFFRQCMPIVVDDAVAERYAEVRVNLKRKGTPIPENDVWIAASCMEVGSALISQDEHFAAIDGLTVIGW